MRASSRFAEETAEEERIMSTRFVSSIVIGLVGAVAVVAGQAFSSGVTGRLTFVVSLIVLTLEGVSQLDPVAVSTGAAAGIGPGRSRPDRNRGSS
jgi:hypothetical protein